MSTFAKPKFNHTIAAWQKDMLEGFGFLFQILGTLSMSWAIMVLIILIKNGHLKSNVAYVPAAGLAAANVGQLILLVGHLSPALYEFSVHGGPNDPCDGIFIILWYGSLGNVLVMAISRCMVTWRPTQAKNVFTLKRMIILSISGFVLGICVAALPYMNVCCHFAFQISTKVIDDQAHNTLPELQETTNFSVAELLSVNYSLVVPNTDTEYLTIIKTNNVLLLTHVVDFVTVFVSIVCYALVFYKVRVHGNKISAQQQQHNERSPHSSQAASGPGHQAAGSRRRRICGKSRKNQAKIDAAPIDDHPNRGHFQKSHQRQTNSRTITSTSDVRMLRRISTHFCLMSSAVMFFSVILLIVHRYPNEPALVLLHQLFYILTSTVNSFLISTLNEKIRGDFRKGLNRIRALCHWNASQSGCCKCKRQIQTDAEDQQRRSAPAAGTQMTGASGGVALATFDLTRHNRMQA